MQVQINVTAPKVQIVIPNTPRGKLYQEHVIQEHLLPTHSLLMAELPPPTPMPAPFSQTGPPATCKFVKKMAPLLPIPVLVSTVSAPALVLLVFLYSNAPIITKAPVATLLPWAAVVAALSPGPAVLPDKIPVQLLPTRLQAVFQFTLTVLLNQTSAPPRTLMLTT